MLYTLCIVAHGLVTHNEKYIGMSTGHKIAVSQKKSRKKAKQQNVAFGRHRTKNFCVKDAEPPMEDPM